MNPNDPKSGEPPGKDWQISEPEQGKNGKKKKEKKPKIIKLGMVKDMLERITPLRG